MDKRFLIFSLFCLFAIGRLHREIREKLTEDFWQKSWKSHTPLARATKINLQYISGNCLCRAPKATPSWILCTKSGGGGCGMYVLVRLSYIPVGSGLTQGKVQKTDFQPES